MSPNKLTFPVEGTYPPMAFISVDLPAPLVPMRPTTSPEFTFIFIALTAIKPPYETEIFFVSRTVSNTGEESIFLFSEVGGVVLFLTGVISSFCSAQFNKEFLAE